MELITKSRQVLGKKSKNLKYERKIPGVIFGKGLKSQAVAVDSMAFSKVYKAAGATDLVDLKISDDAIGSDTDKRTEKVLIKDVQFDPITDAAIHVSFYKVNLKEKLSAEVPVHVVGGDQNAFVKAGEGVVLTLLDHINVEALPSDIPHVFTVDVSGITELGEGIKVSQLEYDRSKVEILDVESDELVVKVDKIVIKEEEPEVAPVSEAEAIAKVEATKELSEEEKKAREEIAKAEKTEKEKEKDKK